MFTCKLLLGDVPNSGQLRQQFKVPYTTGEGIK